MLLVMFHTSTEDMGPMPLMSKFEEITILEMLLSKAWMYLREVRHELFRITESWYDCATICRTIKILV